jgi:hypothetical protein
MARLTGAQMDQYRDQLDQLKTAEHEKNQLEAKSYYLKLVESYPGSPWAVRASDRLVEMGQSGLKAELDS